MCLHHFGDSVSTLLHIMLRLQYRFFKIEYHSCNVTLISSTVCWTSVLSNVFPLFVPQWFPNDFCCFAQYCTMS